MSSRQRATPYLDALRAYATLDPLRLNIPGHKGGPGAGRAARQVIGAAAYAVDLPPLLWGVDRGEPPTPLAQSLTLAAECWGARRTWFLTNGASQGNQAVCLAVAGRGRRAVLQRSMHSSVIDGLVLSGLEPTFVVPALDAELGVAHGISPGALRDALTRTSDVAAAFVVSPSYFGAVADVAGLAAVAHAHDVPLVVDEAWGGHFGFHPELPPGALSLGADLVISSTHKMVGSLTQSAMLHLGDGRFADELEEAVQRCFAAVQSTSESAVLLGSLDGARHRMANEGRRLLHDTVGAAGAMREAIAGVDGVRVVDRAFCRHPEVVAVDPLRIVIDVSGTGRTGFEVADELRAHEAIDFEVVNHRALVVVLGATEGGEIGTARLVRALGRVDVRPGRAVAQAEVPEIGPLVLSPREAFFASAQTVPAAQAVGRVSADALAAYPPGIPNVIPGERITAGLVDFLRATVAAGGFVRGARAPDVSALRVVAAPDR